MSSVSVDSNKLKSLIGAYYDRRMIRILLLGIISGFPWVLIASALSLWLKEEGLSRSTIGWAGLIFGVYAFNFLWAPIIDRMRLPFLTNKIGHRKSIIILMQTIILICLIIWSVLEPTQNLALIIGVGLAKGAEHLDWSSVGRIIASWLVTIPAGAAFTIMFFYILKYSVGV